MSLYRWSTAMVEIRDVLSAIAIFAFLLLMSMLIVVLADFMREAGRQLLVAPIISLLTYHS
jgi:hypothetical protein